MLCSVCGDDNTPTAIACRTCGAPLASAAPILKLGGLGLPHADFDWHT